MSETTQRVYRMVCPHERVLLIGEREGEGEYFDLLESFGGRIEAISVDDARRSEMFRKYELYAR